MKHASRRGPGDVTPATLRAAAQSGPAHAGPTCAVEAGLRVADVMSTDLVVLPAWLSVSALADRVRGSRHAVYPLVDIHGAPVGVLDLASFDAGADRCDLPLAAVGVGVEHLMVVDADAPAAVLAGRPRARRGLILVVRDGRLVGTVGPGCLLRISRRGTLIPRQADRSARTAAAMS